MMRIARGRASLPRRVATVTLSLALSACGGSGEPMVEVAGIDVPQATVESLGVPERATLFDLLALGRAIARDEVEQLGRPIVERVIDGSRYATLPYALAASQMLIDEEALRSAYEIEPERELVVRHVVRLAERGSPAAARDSARRVAERVLAAAEAGEDFATLAARFSEEPGAAERGGMLQPGRRGSWVDEFWEAASALAPGEISGVVESPYGYHVIRLESSTPVPFEEADRSALLRRVIPDQIATGALESWNAGPGAVRLDADAAALALSRLAAGDPPGDTIVIASNEAGPYTGADAIAGWALLAPDERRGIESDPDAFQAWVLRDAEVVLGADAAARLGVEPPREAVQQAMAVWNARVAQLAQVFGFRRGMDDDQLRGAAMPALLSGAPEARAARLDLRSLRPRLHQFYDGLAPVP